ncbi:class I SAM-dependent methyltransferase [Candidatus Microgenomates bacterium]|nr:class I SAM-dependent methyltransferase [Candidatus Microgenomates bacterium]
MQTDQYRQMYLLEDHHWWFLSKRKFISVFWPKTKSRLKILDVGSGTGGLTKYLAKFGNVLGVEISSEAGRYLVQRKIKFVSKSIENCRFPEESFDFVVLGDVLYHSWIKNDQAVLKKISRWLRPHGYLLLTDSAGNFLTSKHDRKMMTRERYSLSVLSERLIKAGFTINRRSYCFFLTFPLFVVSRILNKVIDFDTVSETNKIINQIFLQITSWEAFLLRYFDLPWGSSLIILASKK